MQTHKKAVLPALITRWLSKGNPAVRPSLTTHTFQASFSLNVIRSENVALPGDKKGSRMISRDSLDAFLEIGVERPASVTAMNFFFARHSEIKFQAAERGEA